MMESVIWARAITLSVFCFHRLPAIFGPVQPRFPHGRVKSAPLLRAYGRYLTRNESSRGPVALAEADQGRLLEMGFGDIGLH